MANNIKPMHFMIRPSKTFLFDRLSKELSNFNSEVGLDAGSANFKNRELFKTKKYYGLDIDLQALKNGLKKYTKKNTFAICANLVNLNSLPSNSVDVVVSTNTLYSHFKKEDRPIVFSNLANLVAPDGILLFEWVLDEDFDKYLKLYQSYFNKIKIIYYGNPISRLYEKVFEKNTHLGSHQIAGKKIFRAFSWLISRFEFLTCYYSQFNRHAFIICCDKKQPAIKKEFDLSSLPRIEERLYKLI